MWQIAKGNHQKDTAGKLAKRKKKRKINNNSSRHVITRKNMAAKIGIHESNGLAPFLVRQRGQEGRPLK